jgi:hypothetical protein
MTCFILSEYKRLMGQIDLNRLPNTFEDRHFAPQNWLDMSIVLKSLFSGIVEWTNTSISSN